MMHARDFGMRALRVNGLVLAFRMGLMYVVPYRGTSPERKRNPLGPHRMPRPRALGWSYLGG
jgi:hypothetical protein